MARRLSRDYSQQEDSQSIASGSTGYADGLLGSSTTLGAYATTANQKEPF
ncbi:unnamed protein product [marine sediment metagenome]|uniref:Uncharacterized protein n=1 Tax=marine sediment metagenome TaxID=412755 RepID=X1KJ91_9ZZZZ